MKLKFPRNSKHKAVVVLAIAIVVASIVFSAVDNLYVYKITGVVDDVGLAPGDSGSTTYVVYLQDGQTLELMRSWFHSGLNEDKLSHTLEGLKGQTVTFVCYGIPFDWGPWYMYPKVFQLEY